MNALPPIQRASKGYVATLLVLVALFYLLLIICLGLTGYGLIRLLMFTPSYFQNVRGGGAIQLFFIVLFGVVTFGLGLIGAICTKVGNDPMGIRLSRKKHAKVFDLTDEVAYAAWADPIHEIFLTPENELGVWEEAALYLPQGTGKRKIVLGMGALCYLTLPQLRSVLAHEYGHFSNRDTYFARFIHRVMAGYNDLVSIISASRIQLINPLFWLIRGYVEYFNSLAASFSRRQELAADRFAVEAYGNVIFSEALTAVHVRGEIFNQIGISSAIELAKEGKGFKNIYRFVSESRDDMLCDKPEAYNAAFIGIFKHYSISNGTHPSLRDRLDSQGIGVTQTNLPAVVWPVDPEEKQSNAETGPISAARSLFGDETVAMQHELSEMVMAKYNIMVENLRKAEAGD